VYGTRWYAAGAPDAAKTLLVVQIADEYASRGITVGLLAVDEEPTDIVTRIAQRRGWSRHHCEARDDSVLDGMSAAFGELPIFLYDSTWTIESAAADLARIAAERGDPRAMLGIDSIQTVTCDAELASEREMSEVQAVTARSRAIRAVATRYRLIAVATSELGRGAYRSGDPAQQTATLASAKWSGAIEYSARVLLGLRSVPGHGDLVDIELAKNKHGPRDEHVYVRMDRQSQRLTETSYAPPPIEDRAVQRDTKKRARVSSDAETVFGLIVAEPGITTRDLISAAAGHGVSRDRVYAAVADLKDRIVRRDGKRDAKHHYPAEGA
jgi:KaiC/GvpD/RAD55 family RecA-like ATPase